LAEKDTDQTNERATEVREHLANERTLLSWVRTGVGLTSVGIVVERAGVLVSQQIGGNISELLGLALAVLGCVTLALGTHQFWRNRRQIMRGEFFPSVGVYLVVVAAIGRIVHLLRHPFLRSLGRREPATLKVVKARGYTLENSLAHPHIQCRP
jgi:putative membrane protein